jgi:hypothetical protein
LLGFAAGRKLRSKPSLQLESRFKRTFPRGDLNMKKQTLTAIEIETLALSTSTAPDQRQEPASLDGEDYPSKPATRGRAALHRLIDSFALAACSMVGVYGGVWLDPPDDDAAPPTSPRMVDRETGRYD